MIIIMRVYNVEMRYIFYKLQVIYQDINMIKEAHISNTQSMLIVVSTLVYHWASMILIVYTALIRLWGRNEWILLYVAFSYTIMAISRQNEARSRDYVLLLWNDFKVFLSALYYVCSMTHSRSLHSLQQCIYAQPR